ncbi:hypothetical protein GGR50DRAFT_704915 [Xylaria sp. CBS 124048]|nr:hypothetical protein GGR50DRAFT_704915 [Xylaria sp. CBS 124048]
MPPSKMSQPERSPTGLAYRPGAKRQPVIKREPVAQPEPGHHGPLDDVLPGVPFNSSRQAYPSHHPSVKQNIADESYPDDELLDGDDEALDVDREQPHDHLSIVVRGETHPLGSGNGNVADPSRRLADNPQTEKEKQAIRNLLDTPVVDIPMWEREKESSAMVMRLMQHQRAGLTWLMKQEQGAYKGGILADDMGLGKTIQAIALILARPTNDGARKTTLIVVPTALLDQWYREIYDKIKPGRRLKTLVYHGPKRRNTTVAKLMSHDVVITTYGIVASEWTNIHEKRNSNVAVLLAPHAIFHRIILDEAHNIKNRKSIAFKAIDCLRGTYRLCLTGTPMMNRVDELYSLVRFLRIEPYQAWETFRPMASSATLSSASSGMKQLQVLLSRIFLRRTENHLMDGKPILDLPELTILTVDAEFDPDQKAYYDSLEQHSLLQVNKYLKEGTATRHYFAIFNLLLRLRQCCCHPYLIKDHSIPQGVYITLQEMEKLAKKLSYQAVQRIRAQSQFECPLCSEITENPIILYPCGHHICGSCITNMLAVGGRVDPESGESTSIGRCPCDGCDDVIDSQKVICYNRFAEVHLPDNDSEDSDLDDSEDSDEGSLKDFIVSDDHETSNEEESDDESTGLELGEPDKCPHSEASSEGFPEPRIPMGAVEDGISDSDELPPIDELAARFKNKAELSKVKPGTIVGASDATQKGKTMARFSRGKRGRADNTEDSDSDDGSVHFGVSPGQKKRRAAKDLARPKKKVKKAAKSKRRGNNRMLGARTTTSRTMTVKERHLKRLRRDWETSAKIIKAMELISMIRRDFPDEKTLIFSQFTSFLDLMEIAVSDDGYNYRRYDGTMPNGEREAAVYDFTKRPEVKIMLVSLKCGNAGLNLFAATRVIMLDPFWNPSLEDQAIKRAHRLGQTKPVTAYRILIKETIEDRIIDLQESKRELVGNVLDPEARTDASRLSVVELASLFGITAQ